MVDDNTLATDIVVIQSYTIFVRVNDLWCVHNKLQQLTRHSDGCKMK